MFGLLSAVTLAARLSTASPAAGTTAPPGAATSNLAQAIRQDALQQVRAATRAAETGTKVGAGATAVPATTATGAAAVSAVAASNTSASGAPVGSSMPASGTSASGAPAGSSVPASGTSASGAQAATPGPGNQAVSGTGGAATSEPASGATGDCNVAVTDVTRPVIVRCGSGNSGDVVGVGTGGASGAVVAVATGVSPLATGLVSGAGPASVTAGANGLAVPHATQGQAGTCVVASANQRAKMDLACTPGTVGPAGATAIGGSAGAAGVEDRPDSAGAGPSEGSDGGLAGSGDGGSAATMVATGPTGNCIVHLTNIAAAVTVICVTGNSGTATGLATGGTSGSATLVEAPSRLAGSGSGPGGVALSGRGGAAMAIINSGGTGSCIVYLVNVIAKVTVLCVTGNSGTAIGTAVGGPSGSAMFLASIGAAPAGSGGRPSAATGGGGPALALATSGGTGTCALNVTNTYGRITWACRTGDSGAAEGTAIGGDSGSALVMLNEPSALEMPVAAPLSPFAQGGSPVLADRVVGWPARPGQQASLASSATNRANLLEAGTGAARATLEVFRRAGAKAGALRGVAGSRALAASTVVGQGDEAAGDRGAPLFPTEGAAAVGLAAGVLLGGGTVGLATKRRRGTWKGVQ
ncbi:MAG: hypothetical protein ACRDZ8_07700 [Acidimicrobiales bacterium]